MVLINDLWTWTTIAPKVVNLQVTKLTTPFIKEFWWEKNSDDVNGLSTLKNHSKFEICEIFKILKLKIYWTEF